MVCPLHLPMLTARGDTQPLFLQQPGAVQQVRLQASLLNVHTTFTQRSTKKYFPFYSPLLLI